ncbi:hypothetical protein PIB30_019096 [Stylosanthes scabra]|uniref:Homeobox domain-containing protein n=1 Tax=Stylosanthes scabra TaxID=79078 RepID=A0ABU6U832_9FABA|nr:hypothetical protein [Stylosanthes scabra]
MSHSSFSNLFHSPTTTSSTTTPPPSNSLTTTLLDSIVATPKHPYCICNHCNHLLTLSHHHHHPGYGGVEQGTNNNVQSHNHHHQQGTRWSPTPIQLLVLEELYRQGTKTPSAEQIQQIASQLRRFGKIEGKNVFYWFQNHKARERQKRRRREMEESMAASSTKGLKETGCEVKETKKWASTSNCNAGHAFQECIEISSSEKGSNGWNNNNEFEERVLRRNRSERQAKCQNMASYFNIPSTINIAATTSVASQITHNIQLLSSTTTPHHLQHHNNNLKQNFNSSSDARTLELFPVHKNNDHDEGNNGIVSFSERKSSKVCATASMEEVMSCDQFFEFLPLRN